MINWFDLMRQAQGGAAIENVSRQFGLSPDQTTAAIAALMPAFALSLQRAALNPAAMTQLFQSVAGGPFGTFWESAAQAFTPQARQEGNKLLDQLFGSDEVSRRVAHQAAAFSGVGADILQQMLPLVAGIVAGGLTRMATAPGSVYAGFGAAGQQGAAGPAASAAWVDLWGQWMGVSRPPEPQARAPSSANPFEEMMTTFLRAASPPPPKPPEPEPEPDKPEHGSGPFAAWGQMVETGQEMQRQHLEAMQQIFEGVWGRGGQRPSKGGRG